MDDGSLEHARRGSPLSRWPNRADEFKSVGERAAFQMESLPTELVIPSMPYWWTLRYELPGVLWRNIKRHVPELVRLLDQYGVRNADDLRSELRGLPA
jgi:hypothetical protein